MSQSNDLAKAILDEIERCTLASEPITLSAVEAICERYVGGVNVLSRSYDEGYASGLRSAKYVAEYLSRHTETYKTLKKE